MRALEGRVREHHRFLLAKFLRERDWYEVEIASLNHRIEEQIRPFAFAVALWQTIPGISQVTAWNLVAEIGVRMDEFPSAHHLASWAALWPGNHESAGKRKSGKKHDGTKCLRRRLCQAAWCATRKDDCYLASQFRRLGAHRGMRRAIIAVAHTMPVIGYHMLNTKQEYRELGGDHLDHIHKENLQRYQAKRLQNLGFAVTLDPVFPTS